MEARWVAEAAFLVGRRPNGHPMAGGCVLHRVAEGIPSEWRVVILWGPLREVRLLRGCPLRCREQDYPSFLLAG